MLSLVEDIGVINHLDMSGVLAKLTDAFFYRDIRRDSNEPGMHQAARLVLRVQRGPAAFATALGDHRHFDVAGLVQHLIGYVLAREPPSWGRGGRADEDLRDSVLVRVVHERACTVLAI